jgi:hypothetical protein
MRPLTEPETKTLFEKLATYCGKGISNLIADPSSASDRYVFRIQVFIVSYLVCTLFDSAIGQPSVLCARVSCEPSHISQARCAPLTGNLPGKVYQDGQISTAHHSPYGHRTACAIQSLGQAERRDAFSIWRKCAQSACGTVE